MHPIFMPRNFFHVIGQNGCDGKHILSAEKFENSENQTLRDLKNNQTYLIKDLLTKNIDFSWNGPLETFSNFELDVHHEIQYGLLTPLLLEDLKKKIEIPEEYILYATNYPVGIAGGKDDPLGLIHGLFFENNGLNILSCTNQEKHLGTKIPIIITLYFYKNIKKLGSTFFTKAFINTPQKIINLLWFCW